MVEGPFETNAPAGNALAVGGATIFKLATLPNRSLTRTAFTVGATIFSAWLFTDLLIHFMNWDAEVIGTRLPA